MCSLGRQPTAPEHGAAHFGGRRTVADRPQELATRTNRYGARPGLFVTRPRSGKMMGWRVAFTDDFRSTKKPTPSPLEERGEDGAPLIPTKSHSRRRRPTAASRSSPPCKELQATGRVCGCGWHEERERRRSGDRGSSRRAATAHPRERHDVCPQRVCERRSRRHA